MDAHTLQPAKASAYLRRAAGGRRGPGAGPRSAAPAPSGWVGLGGVASGWAGWAGVVLTPDSSISVVSSDQKWGGRGRFWVSGNHHFWIDLGGPPKVISPPICVCVYLYIYIFVFCV